VRGALPWILLSVLATSACGTSTQVDEFRPSSTLLPLNDNEKVVVVGRRHSGAYETDPDFINCIGTRLPMV
jgi:hypothetical protein